MKIAIITAGGAGMFCGSCMQDNTLARTLRLAGEDAVLVPTYTPIRVDEDDVSVERVFMGGINVYLDSVVPGWKRLPSWMTGWLNRPGIIQKLTRFGNNTDAAHLGSLTLDMLKGSAGPQQREITEFVAYLAAEMQPDLVLFSNALLSGVMPELKRHYSGAVLCLLQGDDIFLDALSKRWKKPVMDQIQANCRLFDGFVTHSQYYEDFMRDYLQLQDARFIRIPLSIDPAIPQAPAPQPNGTIGYFARICPEKGIQNLLASVDILKDHPTARFQIAGYLPSQHRRWFEKLRARAERIAPGQIEWLGSPETREEKFQIISQFDVVCVPTDYPEPKGLYVLEAGLLGIPCVLPNHGAFPELAAELQSCHLYDPGDKDGLSNALQAVLREPPSHDELQLPQRVRHAYGMQETAPRICEAVSTFLKAPE